MALFTKKSPEQKLAKIQEKAIDAARRAGVDTEGAVAVGHAINLDRAYVTLVVRPDRVEIVNHGKVGSPMKEGAGRVVITGEQVSSVSDRREAGRSILEIVHGGGVVTQYVTSHEEAPVLARAIRQIAS